MKSRSFFLVGFFIVFCAQALGVEKKELCCGYKKDANKKQLEFQKNIEAAESVCIIGGVLGVISFALALQADGSSSYDEHMKNFFMTTGAVSGVSFLGALSFIAYKYLPFKNKHKKLLGDCKKHHAEEKKRLAEQSRLEAEKIKKALEQERLQKIIEKKRDEKNKKHHVLQLVQQESKKDTNKKQKRKIKNIFKEKYKDLKKKLFSN